MALALLVLLCVAGVRRAEAAWPRVAVAGDPAAACGEVAVCVPRWLGWLLGPVGWGVAGAVVLGAVGGGWYLWVRRQVRSMDAGPMLVMAQGRASSLAIAGADPEPTPRLPGAAGGGLAGPLIPPLVAGTGIPVPPPLARAPAGRSSPSRFPLPGSRMPAPTRDTPVVPIAGGVHAFLVSEVGGAATPAQPAPVADATLQFLPGRLEVVGERRRPDLRFVRQPGGVTEVTLGRQAGSPDRHIRLEGATVSRLHARLRHAAGRWTITNLSRINPVRINGRALAVESDAHLLTEGDRVEVGELVLVFRER